MHSRIALLIGVVGLLAGAIGACEADRTTVLPTSTQPARSIGGLAISTPGVTLSDVEINGAVDVYASNVTIRRARIRGGPYFAVRQHDDAYNLRIEDSDIGPDSPRSTADGLWVHSFVGTDLRIHDVSDGIKAWSDVQLNRVHISRLTRGPDDHSDGIQIQGGERIRIENSTIDGAMNAAIFVTTDAGRVHDLIISKNRLRGGNFTVAIRTGPYGPPSGVQLIDNRFGGVPVYGPLVSDVPLSGRDNRIENTQKLVPLP